MLNGESTSVAGYYRLMTANGTAHLFRAARETGVLKALADGAGGAGEIAGRAGLAVAPTALLLDALVALGVARSDGERHVLTALGEFVRGSYQDLGDSYWRALPDYLLTGRPVLDVTAPDPGTAFYEGQARAIAWMTAPAVAAAARELGIGGGRRRRGLRVLDAGAGAAGWSIRLAAHDPALRVTALDRPEVIETARQAALRAGIADRFTACGGDLFQWRGKPGSFDLILLANVIHLFPPARIRELFGHLGAALAPGGEIAVLDVFRTANPDDAGNLAVALYALGLALRAPEGRVYRLAEIKSLLAEAGFQGAAGTPLDAPPHVFGMVLARRP